METKPSAQSPFKKFGCGNSSQKWGKNGYQTFPFLSNITGFVHPAPNIFPPRLAHADTNDLNTINKVRKIVKTVEGIDDDNEIKA